MTDLATGAIVGVIMGLIFGLSLGLRSATWQMESEANERGYGFYCPDTGNWAWKGECHD
jgi:hypothetical protein